MPRPKGLTTVQCRERRRVIAAEVAAGNSVAEVARIHSVGLNLVYQACRIENVVLPRKYRIKGLPGIHSALRQENQRLRGALQDLYDAQHKPDLMINLGDWMAAMDKAQAALDDDRQSSEEVS